MPSKDGTGPRGAGPKSGRGNGVCRGTGLGQKVRSQAKTRLGRGKRNSRSVKKLNK